MSFELFFILGPNLTKEKFKLSKEGKIGNNIFLSRDIEVEREGDQVFKHV